MNATASTTASTTAGHRAAVAVIAGAILALALLAGAITGLALNRAPASAQVTPAETPCTGFCTGGLPTRHGSTGHIGGPDALFDGHGGTATGRVGGTRR